MKDLTQKHLSTPLQILIWFCIFCSPLLFKNYNESINWHRYFVGSIVPLIACAIFYINYLWLIPQYLIKGNKKTFTGSREELIKEGYSPCGRCKP